MKKYISWLLIFGLFLAFFPTEKIIAAELPTPVNEGLDVANGTWEWQFNDINGEWQVENIVKYKDNVGKVSTMKAVYSQDILSPTFSLYQRDGSVDKRSEGGKYFLHLDKITVDGTQQTDAPTDYYVFINPGANPRIQSFNDSFNYVSYSAVSGDNKSIAGLYDRAAMGKLERFQTTNTSDSDPNGEKYYCATSLDTSGVGAIPRVIAVPDAGGSYKINTRIADWWNNLWGNSEALYTNTGGAVCFENVAGRALLSPSGSDISGSMSGLYIRGTSGQLSSMVRNSNAKKVTVPVITDAAKAACTSQYTDLNTAVSRFKTKLPELLGEVIAEVDPATAAKKAENIATLATYYKKMMEGDLIDTESVGALDVGGLYMHYFGDLSISQKYSNAVLTDQMRVNIENEMTVAEINDSSDIPPNFFETMFSALGKKAGENPGATVVSLIIIGQVASKYGLTLIKGVGRAAIANPISALGFLVLASAPIIAWNGVQAYKSYWNAQYRSFALYSLFVWYLSSLNAEYKGCIVEKGGLEANLASKTGFSQKALDLQLKNTHLVKHVAGEANTNVVNSMGEKDECGCPKSGLTIAGFNIVDLFNCVICSVFKLLYEGVEDAMDWFQKRAMEVVKLAPHHVLSSNIDIGPPFLIRAG